MKTEIVIQTDQMHVKLEGRVDEVGAVELEKCFRDMDSNVVRQVILDFRQVSYLGSSGVGILLLLYKKMASHQGRISIQNIPKGIYSLLANDMNLGQLFSLSSL